MCDNNSCENHEHHHKHEKGSNRCENHEHHENEGKFRERIQKLRRLAKALHCPPRWDIIEIIGKGELKTREIREEMEERGYDFSKPGLYYHLSELKDSGIIEVSGYVEEGRGAPEKKWKLAREKIEIDLVGSEE